MSSQRRLLLELRKREQHVRLPDSFEGIPPFLQYYWHYKEGNMSQIQILLVGPPTGPYRRGFYRIAMTTASTYPADAPHAKWLTTHDGAVRMGPNLYADGKICLSILGTFSGPSWTAALNIDSVVQSIRSLMHDQPYTNEPGFESIIGTAAATDSAHYSAKVLHESIRTGVVWSLQHARTSGDRFYPYMAALFMMFYGGYIKSCEDNAPLHDGRPMRCIRFEYPQNQISVSQGFQFSRLKKQLEDLFHGLMGQYVGIRSLSASSVPESVSESMKEALDICRVKFGDRMSIRPGESPCHWQCKILRWDAASASRRTVEPSRMGPMYGARKLPPAFEVFFPFAASAVTATEVLFPLVLFPESFVHPCVSSKGIPYLSLPEGRRITPLEVLTDIFCLLQNYDKFDPEMVINDALYERFCRMPDPEKVVGEAIDQSIPEGVEDVAAGQRREQKEEEQEEQLQEPRRKRQKVVVDLASPDADASCLAGQRMRATSKVAPGPAIVDLDD